MLRAMKAAAHCAAASAACGMISIISMMNVIGVAGIMAISAAPSLAQDLTFKPGVQQQAVFIVNARVHTMRPPATGETLANTGTGMIDNADVLFENGRFVSITPRDASASQPAAPAGSVVIDARGAGLYPGLITAWSQLGMTEIQAVAASNDLAETGGITPEVRATTAINPDSTLLPVTRRTGVLLACVAPDGGALSGQLGIIRMDGWNVDTIAVERSIGQVVRWPAMRTVRAWWMDRSEDQQRQDIAAGVKRIEDVFATATNYILAKEGDANALTDLRWEAMRSVLQDPVARLSSEQSGPLAGRHPCYFVAGDSLQIASAVEFAIARSIKPVIVGGREAALVSSLLAKHDVPVIILGVQGMPSRDDAGFDESFILAKQLHESGVRFAFAHGDDTAHERNLPFTVGTAVAHGLPEAAAIRALTIDAAKILGIGDRYGSIEVGKSATFFLCEGASPLEVTSEVTTAFIDGKQVRLTSKQTELAKKYLERYRQEGQLRGGTPQPAGAR
jgi:imidazolonepropionase-like amidohydrolase